MAKETGRSAAAPAADIDEVPAIVVSSLTKRYGTRDALRDVDLTVPVGVCLGIFGANGSGKSTLLRILSTLSRSTAGSIVIAGRTLPREAAHVRSRIGVLFDRSMVPSELTLREGLTYWADLYRVREARARIEELVERFGLTWRLRDPLRTFSRGMQQRVSLACALLHDPEILLLDEPFVALDREGCRLVEEAVDAHRKRGGTTLLVSHDLERARRVVDEAVVLRRGEVVFRGRRGAWSFDEMLAVYR